MTRWRLGSDAVDAGRQVLRAITPVGVGKNDNLGIVPAPEPFNENERIGKRLAYLIGYFNQVKISTASTNPPNNMKI